jgi:hypothetical protein
MGPDTNWLWGESLMYKFEFVEKVAIDNHLTIQGWLEWEKS